MLATIKTSLFRLSLLFACILFLECSKTDHNSNKTQDEATLSFVKTLGGSKNESAQAIVNTSDGGYAILGYAQSMDGELSNKKDDSFDFWLLKFDQNDILQWQKHYGGTDEDRGQDIIQTADGGYAIIGFTKSNSNDVLENNGAQDYWVSKLDASGNISWKKNFGFSGVDIGYSIIETQDNGFLLSGVLDVSASNGAGNSKNSNTKGVLHAGGDYSQIDEARGITKSKDGNYIIVGDTRSNDKDVTFNNGAADLWVIKISPAGELIWEKTFGGSNFDVARSITATQNDTFIISGSSRSADGHLTNNNGQNDAWVLKIDSNGQLKWQKSIGGSNIDFAQDAAVLHNNSIIVVGHSSSSNLDVLENKGFSDVLIVKIE